MIINNGIETYNRRVKIFYYLKKDWQIGYYFILDPMILDLKVFNSRSRSLFYDVLAKQEFVVILKVLILILLFYWLKVLNLALFKHKKKKI